MIPIFVFVVLSVILLLTGEGLNEEQTFPILSGILAWSLLLFEMLIAARPKFMEKIVGLPELYAVHGLTGVVILFISFSHARSGMSASNQFTTLSFVRPTGSLSTLLFLIATVTGALVLSGILARHFKWITRFQKKRCRETSLVLHGLSAITVLLLYAHMMAVDIVRANTLFCVLIALRTILTEGVFFASKVKARHMPKYTLKNLTKLNKDVFNLEMVPVNGKLLDYYEGQYIFLNFIDSALPKQSHPFSISSTPESRDSLVLTIKENGDYTRRLSELKPGDTAVLEGPYGHFYKEYDRNSDKPLIFLAGGIGITPLLGIIRTQIKIRNNRKMILLWSLTEQSDVLFQEELQSIQQNALGFSYYITLSREKAEGFGYGRISIESLKESGVLTLQGKGDYFLCGPLPMMRGVKSLLLKNGISEKQIHMEEFSF